MAENTWVTGVATAINGVITPLKTGRGSQTILGCDKKNQPFLSLQEQLAGDDPLKLPGFCWIFQQLAGDDPPKLPSFFLDLSRSSPKATSTKCLLDCSISFGTTPDPVTVTTRIIPFLVGNPYKPSFVTVTDVTGWGVDQRYLLSLMIHQSFSHFLINFNMFIIDQTLHRILRQEVKFLDLRVFEFSDLGILQKSAMYFVACLKFSERWVGLKPRLSN